ncbi:hypothetical protein PFISCL1PPCAC_22044, partial [Pristionchus fissidentatus]
SAYLIRSIMRRSLIFLCSRIASSSTTVALPRITYRLERACTPTVSQRWNSTTPTVDTPVGTQLRFEPEVYSEEELVVGERMLRRIVGEMKERGGGDFIIPWHDEDTVAEILAPLKQMIGHGVKPSFVISVCIAEPSLFSLLARRGAVASRVMAVLVDSCRLPYEDVCQFMAVYGEELVREGAEGVQTRIDRLTALGVGTDVAMGRLIRSCPALLFAVSETALGATAEAIGGFFSRKQISSIVQKCPQALLQNVDEVEAKYEYIYFQMCMEGSEFLDCSRWAEASLDEIMARHEFLLKCGRYTTPDKKNPQIKMENPSLHEILDSSHEHFACAVAAVTTEEWILYQALREKLASGPPSFERIKPSKRKAYERRAKEGEAIPDHVFDATREKLDRVE